MAISNLVSGGQSFERPSVSAFFGNAPKASNDNVQRVSSDFLSNDIFRTITGAFDRIGAELSRIQDTSKSIMKSFDALIRNARELNRDVTKRFTDVNNQLNRSKIEFLRSLMLTPVPASSTPTTLGALVDNAQKSQEETKKQEEKKDESKSWMDTLGDWLSTAGDVASMGDMFKKGGGAGAAAGEAKAGSKMAGFLGKSAGVAGRLLGKLAVPLAVATSAYDAYQGFTANEDAGIGEKLGNAGSTVLHGLTFGLLGKSSEQITQDANTNKLEAVQQFESLPASTQKYWQTWPELIKAWTDGTIKKDDRAKIMKMFADGESEKATSLAARIAGIEAARTEPKLAASKKNITGRNLAATIGGPEATRDVEGFRESVEKASRGIERATEDRLDEDTMTNKRIAGLATRNGLDPGTVTATLEGGIPTSLTSNGVTIDVYNDLTPEEKEKVQDARKRRGENRNTAEKKNLDTGAAITPPAVDAMGNATGAGASTPSGTGGSTEGAGGPEKAPSASGGDTGVSAAPAAGTPAPAGGSGGSTESAPPAGSPAPAASPPSPSGGESASGAASAPSAPNPETGSSATAPPPEGTPAAAGTPSASPASPTTPPAPPATPEPPAAGEPVVLNNSNVQNNGSTSGGNSDKMAGQNFPMTVQNDRLKEYLAAQTMDYQ